MVGTALEAGLPNITGRFYVGGKVHDSNGVFTLSGTGDQFTKTSSGSQKIVTFNATLASSIYGKSATVQPAAILVNYIIKAS